jgi:hypothetical protein
MSSPPRNHSFDGGASLALPFLPGSFFPWACSAPRGRGMNGRCRLSRVNDVLRLVFMASFQFDLEVVASTTTPLSLVTQRNRRTAD